MAPRHHKAKAVGQCIRNAALSAHHGRSDWGSALTNPSESQYDVEGYATTLQRSVQAGEHVRGCMLSTKWCHMWHHPAPFRLQVCMEVERASEGAPCDGTMESAKWRHVCHRYWLIACALV